MICNPAERVFETCSVYSRDFENCPVSRFYVRESELLTDLHIKKEAYLSFSESIREVLEALFSNYLLIGEN